MLDLKPVSPKIVNNKILLLSNYSILQMFTYEETPLKNLCNILMIVPSNTYTNLINISLLDFNNKQDNVSIDRLKPDFCINDIE